MESCYYDPYFDMKYIKRITIISIVIIMTTKYYTNEERRADVLASKNKYRDNHKSFNRLKVKYLLVFIRINILIRS